MTLMELPVGVKATVVGFAGFGHSARRASNLGLHVGARVEKLQHFGWHSLVKVGDCRIGMCSRIMARIIVMPEKI
jgi:Fe2+ transport system protein FeoA